MFEGFSDTKIDGIKPGDSVVILNRLFEVICNKPLSGDFNWLVAKGEDKADMLRIRVDRNTKMLAKELS